MFFPSFFLFFIIPFLSPFNPSLPNYRGRRTLQDQIRADQRKQWFSARVFDPVNRKVSERSSEAKSLQEMLKQDEKDIHFQPRNLNNCLFLLFLLVVVLGVFIDSFFSSENRKAKISTKKNVENKNKKNKTNKT